MKTTSFFMLLFLFALVFAAGFVADKARADCPCQRWQCICELYCSDYAGPACIDIPTRPYYLYEINCVEKPGEHCPSCSVYDWGFIGCCRFGAP